MSINKRVWIPLLLCLLFATGACQYIVLPPGIEQAQATESAGWSAMVTDVGISDSGDLRIALSVRNDTEDWSAMQANTPAVLKVGNTTTDCQTVFVGTGGHRLAPGFQIRGYTGGTKYEPELQLLYVDCSGVEAGSGATLTLDYTYWTGRYNYYEQDANEADGTFDLALDNVEEDLTYPVVEEIEGVIQQPEAQIEAINDCVLELTGVERTDGGLVFNWQTTNPGEYNTYVHIGIPPVIGSDGIIYGVYESPDIASVPITPPDNGTAEWTTEVAVPDDVTDLYILLSVETGKQRLFQNYAVDIAEH